MATKKKRGLGAAPADHLETAKFLLKSAADNLSMARDNTSHCAQMYSALTMANADHQQASAEMGYAGIGTRVGDKISIQSDKLLDKYQKLNDRFEKKCLVGGGLSGMKRRSRR